MPNGPAETNAEEDFDVPSGLVLERHSQMKPAIDIEVGNSNVLSGGGASLIDCNPSALPPSTAAAVRLRFPPRQLI